MVGFILAGPYIILTGITEPVEYVLFVAPWLYVIHAFLDGLSFILLIS